jgi:methionyl aminopeptidase
MTYSKEEVEVLREGGRRLAGILNHLAPKLQPGVSTLWLENMARKFVEEGGDKPAFLGYTPSGAKRPYPAALCVSVNDEVVHGIPNEDPVVIREGDVVTLDLGLNHKGLITDSAITVGVGEVGEDLQSLIEATKKSLYAGIGAAKAGNTTGDIGYAIQKEASKYPFGLVTELGGHGVGRTVHDEPYVPNYGRRGEGDELVSGMVIAIEPQLALGSGKVKLSRDGYTFKTRDGSVAAHFEHTVLVTDDGCEILTKS